MRVRRRSLPLLLAVLALSAGGIVFASRNPLLGLDIAWPNVPLLTAFVTWLYSTAVNGIDAFIVWLSDHYQRAPTLVLGLVTLIAFPMIAIFSALFRALSAQPQSTDIMTESTERHRTAHRKVMPVSDREASSSGMPVWPSKAMVELRDPSGRRQPARIPLHGPVVQIGRSDDVDIIISDPTVHRHHATIHCTEDAEFLVTDLSAGTGNGVVVNGQPVLQHKIFNGDEIRLGRARLTFLTAQT